MAKCIEFPEADGVADFAAPKESRPLPIKAMGENSVSCWQLTSEELAEVARTGTVWVSTSTLPRPDGGRIQPAMRVTAFKDRALQP